MTALVTDPASPRTVYAATFDAGVFKSVDAGASWAPCGALVDPHVQTLVLFRGSLYAGVYGPMMRSADGGATWAPVISPLPLLDAPTFVTAFTQGAGWLYAAGSDGGFPGVWKSADGASWFPLNEGLEVGTPTPAAKVVALVAHPAHPRWLVAGSESGGVYRTTNGGATWTRVPSDLSGLCAVRALAHDVTAPATVYAGCALDPLAAPRPSLFVSRDSGANWSVSAAGLGKRSVLSLLSLPGGVYAGTRGGGVFRSVDHGATWVAARDGLSAETIGAFAATGSSPIYAGTGEPFAAGQGVFKSANGATWTLASSGLRARPALVVAPDLAAAGRLFVGTYGGIWRSDDRGSGWSLGANRIAGRTVTSLLLDPVTPAKQYALAGDGVFKSADGGGHWKRSDRGLSDLIVLGANPFALDPSAPERLYVGAFGLGRSADGAASWSAVPLPAFRIAALSTTAAQPGLVAAATCAVPHGPASGGLWLSDDFGASWQARAAPDTIAPCTASVALAPGDAAVIYVLSYLGVAKSVDGGAHFTTVLPPDDLLPSPNTLWVDPGNADHVLLLTGVAGSLLQPPSSPALRESIDGGVHWQSAMADLPLGVAILGVAQDPFDAQTIYLATMAGLFRRSGPR